MKLDSVKPCQDGILCRKLELLNDILDVFLGHGFGGLSATAGLSCRGRNGAVALGELGLGDTARVPELGVDVASFGVDGVSCRLEC